MPPVTTNGERGSLENFVKKGEGKTLRSPSCAASPASFVVEYSLGANPMIHDLVEETIEVKDGMVAIPDRPGLGFTISEEFVQAHAQT